MAAPICLPSCVVMGLCMPCELQRRHLQAASAARRPRWRMMHSSPPPPTPFRLASTFFSSQQEAQQCLQSKALTALPSTQAVAGALAAMCDDMPDMEGCSDCADGSCKDPLGECTCPLGGQLQLLRTALASFQISGGLSAVRLWGGVCAAAPMQAVHHVEHAPAGHGQQH